MHRHPTQVGKAPRLHRASQQLQGGRRALALERQGTVLLISFHTKILIFACMTH